MKAALVRPNACVVLRFVTKSNFVGCSRYALRAINSAVKLADDPRMASSSGLHKLFWLQTRLEPLGLEMRRRFRPGLESR